MVKCRKCDQEIVGQGFGSKDSGWEHPFDGCEEARAEAFLAAEQAWERGVILAARANLTAVAAYRKVSGTGHPEMAARINEVFRTSQAITDAIG